MAATNKVYIIAEMSANHNQDFETAAELIQVAHYAGADAIKIQTYTPDTMTIKSPRPEFLVKGGTPWDGTTLYDLYSRAFLPWEWIPDLQRIATGLGLDFFSSVYDRTSVDFMEKLGVPAYKIASYELNDLDLISYAAATGKPLIMSTGMASMVEIKTAVKAAGKNVTILKCTTAYPTPFSAVNLHQITELRSCLHVPVGLSDHTLGITVPVASVPLGVTMIEKHITVDREFIDGEFSLMPREFKAMVEAVRNAEAALSCDHIHSVEAESRQYRRSLYAVADIVLGEQFSRENVRSIRPGNGLPPSMIDDVLQSWATVDISLGTPLAKEMLGI